MAVNDVVCDISELPEEVAKILESYGDKATDCVDGAVREVTKAAKEVIKANANVDKRNVARKGKYQRSIKYKIERDLIHTEGIVYASGHEYSLTHLLENGHDLWNNPGRRTRAYKHWKLGEELAIETLPRTIVEKLKG